jgi:ketosteroid isomerase-like protein
LRGDRALVGAIRGDGAATDSGAAYLFERQANGEWLEVARVSAADGAGGDRFGQSVSFSDTFAVVGASNDQHIGELAGSAYVFERQPDGQWLEVAKLIAEGATAEDFFGSSVSLQGNRVMIGAFGANGAAMNSGAAYVFERQPDESWLEVARLDASDGAAGDYFGFWVSLDGDRALISALFDRTAAGRTGSAYVFERQADGQWLQTRKLQAGDGAAEDRFGWRVSLDQDRALIGALGDGDRGNSSGSAYLFSLKADGQWSEAVKLTAADGANGDRFGGSVALGNDRALIGAYNDNDAGRDSGAVYLFENLEGPDRSVLFSDRFQ